MNDRLITLAGATLALVFVVGMFYSPAQPAPPRPTSELNTQEGYAGMMRWFELSSVPTLSLRRRYTELPTVLPAETGNILFTVVPNRSTAQAEELSVLDDWLHQGNTLVILAALNDTPDWSKFDRHTFEELQDLTQLRFIAYQLDDEALLVGQALEATPLTLTPVNAHPLMQNVHSLHAQTATFTNLHSPTETDVFVMQAARMQEDRAGAIWQVARTKGDIILIGTASLLSNQLIDKADNATFLHNILRYHLGPGGTVIFDDYHQGLSDLYDPQAFFQDARFWNSIGFVLLFWLLYMVGSQTRLEKPAALQVPARQSDLVSAVAGFMDRKLTVAETGCLMVEQWLRGLQGTHILPTAASALPATGALSALEAMPLVDQTRLARVQQTYARAGAGEKVNLQTLHNDLLELTRNLR